MAGLDRKGQNEYINMSKFLVLWLLIHSNSSFQIVIGWAMTNVTISPEQYEDTWDSVTSVGVTRCVLCDMIHVVYHNTQHIPLVVRPGAWWFRWQFSNRRILNCETVQILNIVAIRMATKNFYQLMTKFNVPPTHMSHN